MAQHNAGLADYDLTAGASGEATTPPRVRRSSSVSQSARRNTSDDRRGAGCRGWQYFRTRTVAVIGFLTVVVVGQVILTNLTKLLVDRRPAQRSPVDRLLGIVLPVGARGDGRRDVRRDRAAHRSRPFATHQGLPRSRRGIIAVSVATTRVFLGVHWLTDVSPALRWAGPGLQSLRSHSVVAYCASGNRLEVAQQEARAEAVEQAGVPSPVP